MSLQKAIGKAVRLYEDFREARPRKIGAAMVKLPKAVAVIGYLESVDYRTTHGGKSELYRHDFQAGSRPLLTVSEDGKQLLLLGGRYQFTAQGIVDKDSRGKLITQPKHGKTINPRLRRKSKTRSKLAKRNPGEFHRLTPVQAKQVAIIVQRELQALTDKRKVPKRSPEENTLMLRYASAYGHGGPKVNPVQSAEQDAALIRYVAQREAKAMKAGKDAMAVMAKRSTTEAGAFKRMAARIMKLPK